MMQEVEVLKTIQELICSFFSEEQFTLSNYKACWTILKNFGIIYHISKKEMRKSIENISFIR